MHRDVHVMDIEDSESESQGAQRPNKKNPSADVDEFFEKVPHQKGDKKGRRRCKSCAYISSFFFYIYINDYLFTDRNGFGCTTRESILVDDCTTLRRHMASLHKV